MELSTSFTVAQPVDEVWAALTDLPFVAACIPGAGITETRDDGTFAGTLTVRMGSIHASFDGTARFDEVDMASRRVRLVASGTSALGEARLNLRGTAQPVAGGTQVLLQTEVELSGRLAQLGHGVGARVTERLIDRMAETLERRLVGGSADAEAPDALPLLDLLRSTMPAQGGRIVRVAAAFGAGLVAGWLFAGILQRRHKA